MFAPRQLAEGLARAGLATTGVGFAHALHTPYWMLRSIAGLPNADESVLVRAYQTLAANSCGVGYWDRADASRAVHGATCDTNDRPGCPSNRCPSRTGR